MLLQVVSVVLACLVVGIALFPLLIVVMTPPPPQNLKSYGSGNITPYESIVIELEDIPQGIRMQRLADGTLMIHRGPDVAWEKRP